MNDNFEINISTLIKNIVKKFPIFLLILLVILPTSYILGQYQKSMYSSKVEITAPSNFFSGEYVKTERFIFMMTDYVNRLMELQITSDLLEDNNIYNQKEYKNMFITDKIIDNLKLLNSDVFSFYSDFFLSIENHNKTIDVLNQNSEFKISNQTSIYFTKIFKDSNKLTFQINSIEKGIIPKFLKTLNILSNNETKKELIKIFKSKLEYPEYLLESMINSKIIDINSNEYKYAVFFRDSAISSLNKIEEIQIYDTRVKIVNYETFLSKNYSYSVILIFAVFISIIIYFFYIIYFLSTNEKNLKDV